MTLYGRMKGVTDGKMLFEPNLIANLAMPTGSITASTH